MLDLLRNNTSNDPCLVDLYRNTISYKNLSEIAHLYRPHISPRSLIFIIANSSIKTIGLYVQALRSSAVVLLLDKSISSDYLQLLIDRFDPNIIAGEINQEHNLTGVLSSDSSDEFSLLTRHKNDLGIHKDIAILLTTSGSTSSPKLVKITYENLLYNTKSICSYLEIKPTDRHITTLPMNYTYGLSCINTHLLSGATVMLNEDSVVTRDFWSKVNTLKPTTMSGVPFTYEVIIKAKLLSTLGESSIIKLTQAGGRLSNKNKELLIRMCDKFSKLFYVMYGQTEATARISYVPPHAIKTKLESIGVPIPYGSLYIKSENGDLTAKPNINGEIVYKGPNIFTGYASKLDDLQQLENIEFLETGDIGYSDSDGYFYITSRKSNFAKISGKRISLTDIDKIVEQEGFQCVTISDNKKITINIEMKNLTSTSHQSLNSIKALVCNRASLHPSHVSIRVINEIPRLTNGKINKKELG